MLKKKKEKARLTDGVSAESGLWKWGTQDYSANCMAWANGLVKASPVVMRKKITEIHMWEKKTALWNLNFEMILDV